ncbi:MAG: histidine phosphatase family protein [Ruminococcus sp.]|nr:histidine phosphatase family protein [Ruminococcus sp.]
MKSYYIHFIRHGEISPTLSGKYIGTTDIPLSEEGKTKLRRLDYEMKYPYAAAVFTSPLKRCTQTAKIIYPEKEAIIIDGLTECHFGEWENKSADEMLGDPEFQKWLAGDTSVKPPRGESNADFVRRICLTFEQIVNGLIKSGVTDSAIITHGGVMTTLLSVYGLPSAKPFDWACDNGFGYSLRITPMLWQRDKVAEVFRRIPEAKEED